MSAVISSGALGASSITFYYQVMKGKFVEAALIPVVGYALKKTGEQFKSETITSIGQVSLFGSLVIAPGSCLAYTIYQLSGQSFPGGALAFLGGAALTYKVYEKVQNIMVEGVVKASCSLR